MSSNLDFPEIEVSDTGLDTVKKLVIYNDDVNSFEHVIICLITYCDHTAQQAEQCTLLIHYKGSCSVKTGSMDDLKPIKDALIDQGLSVIIEG